MNILIIGSGAREHALAWKLAQSPRASAIYTAPGNSGTAQLGQNLAYGPLDFESLAFAAKVHRIDLVVVGPEAPLAAGIVDYFQERGFPIFGPTKAAAAIEASKSFARGLMLANGVPCAKGESFTDVVAARAFVRSFKAPPVIKADGLAAGKGVTVAQTHEEALEALDDAMVRDVFGEAGKRVVVEERLVGREASVFALTDGVNILQAVPACDYKRIGDGDTGPNTGGMGSYSPPEFLSEAIMAKITDRVFRPVIRAMAGAGTPYRGVLYAGLMIDQGEPKVIEFNCRLGDPETQVILPRLESDLLDILEAVANRKLTGIAPKWSDKPCVGVVMASKGYPGQYQTGKPISGLNDASPGVVVFHGGTRVESGVPVTAGGRVFTVSALGESIAQARDRAYGAVARIRFHGAYYRKDIALRAV